MLKSLLPLRISDKSRMRLRYFSINGKSLINNLISLGRHRSVQQLVFFRTLDKLLLDSLDCVAVDCLLPFALLEELHCFLVQTSLQLAGVAHAFFVEVRC